MTLSAPRAPLRVMHLGSPTGLFGAERWILALCRYLPPDRVASVIAAVKDAPEDEPALCASARSMGFEAIEIPARGRISLAAIKGIRAALRNSKIDILHTHGYKQDVLGMLAAVGTECRLMSTPHGWNSGSGLKVWVYEALERLAFARFDAIVPLSQELLDGLSVYPWVRGKLTLVRNGVDLGEVSESRSIATEILGLRAAGGFVYGYIGQLISRKRIDLLIRAFAQLPASNAHLVLIGEGPLRCTLEALVRQLDLSGRVHFFGFRDDRIAFLKGFDVFVLPSVLEGIPRSVLEAMAAGVATVASDIEGVRGLVRHEETGLLFEADDEIALGRMLQRLYFESSLRRRLAEQGRTTVQAHFSAADMAVAYAAHYERLMADRSS